MAALNLPLFASNFLHFSKWKFITLRIKFSVMELSQKHYKNATRTFGYNLCFAIEGLSKNCEKSKFWNYSVALIQASWIYSLERLNLTAENGYKKQNTLKGWYCQRQFLHNKTNCLIAQKEVLMKLLSFSLSVLNLKSFFFDRISLAKVLVTKMTVLLTGVNSIISNINEEQNMNIEVMDLIYWRRSLQFGA